MARDKQSKQRFFLVTSAVELEVENFKTKEELLAAITSAATKMGVPIDAVDGCGHFKAFSGRQLTFDVAEPKLCLVDDE